MKAFFHKLPAYLAPVWIPQTVRWPTRGTLPRPLLLHWADDRCPCHMAVTAVPALRLCAASDRPSGPHRQHDSRAAVETAVRGERMGTGALKVMGVCRLCQNTNCQRRPVKSRKLCYGSDFPRRRFPAAGLSAPSCRTFRAGEPASEQSPVSAFSLCVAR